MYCLQAVQKITVVIICRFAVYCPRHDCSACACAGIIVLLALQFLTPIFFYIPNASLSCVIIMAVIDMVTFQKLWIFWKTKSK